MATTRFDPIRATVLWCSFNRRKIALEIAPFVTRNCNCKLRETLKKDRPHNSHRKSKWRKPSISRTGDKGRCNLAKLKSLLVCLEHMKMYVHAPLFCLGFWSLSLLHLYKTSQQFKMHWFFACTLTNNQDSHCCNLKLMRLSTTKNAAEMEFTKSYYIYEWNQYQLQCHQGTPSEQDKKTNCNKVFSKHSIRIEPRDRIAKIEFIKLYYRIPIRSFFNSLQALFVFRMINHSVIT